jgi:hypothetical protein
MDGCRFLRAADVQSLQGSAIAPAAQQGPLGDVSTQFLNQV